MIPNLSGLVARGGVVLCEWQACTQAGTAPFVQTSGMHVCPSHKWSIAHEREHSSLAQMELHARVLTRQSRSRFQGSRPGSRLGTPGLEHCTELHEGAYPLKRLLSARAFHFLHQSGESVIVSQRRLCHFICVCNITVHLEKGQILNAELEYNGNSALTCPLSKNATVADPQAVILQFTTY